MGRGTKKKEGTEGALLCWDKPMGDCREPLCEPYCVWREGYLQI